jgi:hypothetical protein
MKTIILKELKMDFIHALQYLLNGKCIGILPGDNSNYIVNYKPTWMNKESPDYLLKWNNSKEDNGIRTDQFLDDWYPVIIDHNDISL